jgi:hypothetical protein
LVLMITSVRLLHSQACLRQANPLRLRGKDGRRLARLPAARISKISEVASDESRQA